MNENIQRVVIFADDAERSAHLAGGGVIPAGAVVLYEGEGAPRLSDGSPIASTTDVQFAIASGASIPDWQAAHVYTANEVVRAAVAVGTIDSGDIIRRISTGTSGATFDATEAAGWTNLGAELVRSVAGKSGAVTLVKADVGLGSVDNTSDAGKPVSTATQTALNAKQDASTAATDAELAAHTGNISNPHAVTKAQVGLGNVDNTSDTTKNSATATLTNKTITAPVGIVKGDVGLGNVDNTSDANKPVSTAQQTALDAKQATLVSGTNIKTVNGGSVVGAGNITVAADLPGGVAATALDDGIDAGNAVVDRTTVPGQTILKYQTPGASTFKVPLGVTSIWVLAIGGGGAGGSSHSGGAGGAGRFVENAALAVTPGQTLVPTVAAGGVGSAGSVWASASAGIGGDSSLGATVIATGGGRGAYGDETGNASSLEDATVGGSGGAGSGGNADHIKAGQVAAAGTSTGGASPNATGFGFAGGTGSQTGGTYGVGGGGGGASAAGANGVGANGSTGSAGGAGRASSITGVAVDYAGGGGGGGWSAAGGAGGIGGGGSGGQNDGVGAGSSGTANTGGGGGGSNAAGTSRTGGNGGSGIVIIRFATQSRSYKALALHATNAAAISAGLLIGQFYRDSSTGAVQQIQ